METQALLSPERVHPSLIRCALFGAMGFGVGSIIRVFGFTRPAAVFWLTQAAAGAVGGLILSMGPRTNKGARFAIAGLPAALIYIVPWYASKLTGNPLVLYVGSVLAGHVVLGLCMGIAEGKSPRRKTTMVIAAVAGIPLGILMGLPGALLSGAIGSTSDSFVVLQQGLFGAGLGIALGVGLGLLASKEPDL